ncbi:MAG: ferrous iron transport protein A [Burkholderiaceae bacterium]|nr:ferrous iron transport protein A [Burkholderiaceae bacterium]
MTTTATTLTLSDLASGVGATVVSINDNANGQVDASMTARLGELGFLPGERVSVLRRGPGGREPLAVQVGDTVFALRKIEADCILVNRAPAP